MKEIELVRTNHLIDPSLHIWGWEIPVYLFLGGLTAGLMILTALLGRRDPAARSRWLRWMPFAAPIALSIGMLALFIDLEFRLHVYRFYLALQWRSPMSWGAWILVAIYPATILYGLAGLTEGERDSFAAFGPLRPLRRLILWAHGLGKRWEGSLRWITFALGLGLGVYTGILLGNLGARAVWNSSLLGPLFLVSGFSAGAAMLMLFPLAEKEQHTLRLLDMGAIAVELALIALFFIGLASGSAASQQAADLFLGGRFTATFWSLVVIGGLAVPLLIEAVEPLRALRPTRAAPLLVLVGGLALRWILVLAGQV